MNPFAAVTGTETSGGPDKADFERIVHLCARAPGSIYHVIQQSSVRLVCEKLMCNQALMDEDSHRLFRSLARLTRPMGKLCLWLET